VGNLSCDVQNRHHLGSAGACEALVTVLTTLCKLEPSVAEMVRNFTPPLTI
jgi:hypothetical protein